MGNSLLLILGLLAAMLVLIPINGLIINALGFLGQSLKLKREVLITLIIGFAVSLPELLIAINALIFNQPELAVGNALGSGLILMTLVAGLIAIYTKSFKTNTMFSRKHLVFMSLATTLPIALAFDGRISRTDGIILIITYVIYLLILVSTKSSYSIIAQNVKNRKKSILNIVIVLIGLCAAFIAAYIANYISRELFVMTNFSLFFIGLIFVAPLGAIPELIFEMELNKKGKSNLTLGELFTSIVTNTTLIIGITALFAPISIVTNVVFYFAAFFFVVVLILFNIYVHSKDSLDWKEGLMLVLAYIIFLLSSITLVF